METNSHCLIQSPVPFHIIQMQQHKHLQFWLNSYNGSIYTQIDGGVRRNSVVDHSITFGNLLFMFISIFQPLNCIGCFYALCCIKNQIFFADWCHAVEHDLDCLDHLGRLYWLCYFLSFACYKNLLLEFIIYRWIKIY